MKKYASTVVFITVLALLISLSSLLHNASIGQVIILLYGVYAVIRKVSSDTTLIMALTALATVMVITLFHISEDLADTFAIYSLLLLLVWAVSRALERNISQKDEKMM